MKNAKPLTAKFFHRPVLDIAPELLGMYLVGPGGLARKIVEVEAYDGPDDRACHAHRGRTARNAPMFGPGGRWYVYLCYGMHWMLNAVAGPEGYPAAVLIRGVEGTVGPGRLTKLFDIDTRHNARDISEHTGLWIEDRGEQASKRLIKRGQRIGVDYAGAWAKKPYRFFL